MPHHHDTCEIPYLLYQGGSSKGPLMLGVYLPTNEIERDKVLLEIMGSLRKGGQVDGLGGGHALANKVMLIYAACKSKKAQGIDVEYLLCQVTKDGVDTSIDCGNMLSAVGPYAIETNLVKATHPETTVKIFSRNTNRYMESVIQTPEGKVNYKGDSHVEGIEDSGAPIQLTCLDPAGVNGTLPTNQTIDHVDGIDISCVDVSMPLIIVEACSLSKTGHESKNELDQDLVFMQKLEKLRKAGISLMHLNPDDNRAVAKICMISDATDGGNIKARYFISPKDNDTHPSFAVTGAICLSSACCIPGTLANRHVRFNTADMDNNLQKKVTIEHPSGKISATVTLRDSASLKIERVSYVRTAKLISTGQALVYQNPPKIFNNIARFQSLFKTHPQIKHSLQNKSMSTQIAEITNLLQSSRFDEAIDAINLMKTSQNTKSL